MEVDFKRKFDYSSALHEDPANIEKELKLQVTKLILRGPGKWTHCRCPFTDSNTPPDEEQQPTSLEELQIGTTYSVSSCALLHLLIQSPNIKKLIFYGILTNCNHLENFTSNKSTISLETIHWPYHLKAPQEVLIEIVSRCTNLTNFFAPELTLIKCIKHTSNKITDLKALCINLADSWAYDEITHNFQRARDINQIKSFTNLQTLEVRFHKHIKDENPEEEIEKSKVEKLNTSLDQHQINFWNGVASMTNLKALSVFGEWSFCKTCRELAKRALEIEYLRINLHPQSIRDQIEEEEDNIIYSCDDGLSALQRLPKLKMLQLSCSEKLVDMTEETNQLLKSLINAIYILDIKIPISPLVEDFLTLLVRRGRQMGRVYRIRVCVAFDVSSESSSILFDVLSKFKPETDIGEKLREMAFQKMLAETPEKQWSTISIWYIKLDSVISQQGRLAFENMESEWKQHFDLFDQNLRLQM